MPVRREAVRYLVDRAFGGPWRWNGLTGEIHEGETAKSGMTADGYDKLRLLVDDLFMDVVNEINWSRVLIEAAVIHMERHPDKNSPWLTGSTVEEDGICGQCVADALKTGEHNRFEPESVEEMTARYVRLVTLKDWANKVKPWKTLPECYREDPAVEEERREAKAFLDDVQARRRAAARKKR